MRYSRSIGIVVLIVGLVCAIAYAELVYDFRTTRETQLAQSNALGVNVDLSLERYNKIQAEMMEKYGERAKPSLKYPPGRITVELDGKLILDTIEKAKFSEVLGLFAMGPGGAELARFPFRLQPGQHPDALDRRLAENLKNRFSKQGFPLDLLTFEDREWTIDNCAPLPPGLGLGWFGEMIGLREGTACIVTWKRGTPVSMLISVSIADGDPWMRTFTRRLCRSITAAALTGHARDAPKYAACVLADRPLREGAQEILTSHVFSVDPNGRLAMAD